METQLISVHKERFTHTAIFRVRFEEWSLLKQEKEWVEHSRKREQYAQRLWGRESRVCRRNWEKARVAGMKWANSKVVPPEYNNDLKPFFLNYPFCHCNFQFGLIMVYSLHNRWKLMFFSDTNPKAANCLHETAFNTLSVKQSPILLPQNVFPYCNNGFRFCIKDIIHSARHGGSK